MKAQYNPPEYGYCCPRRGVNGEVYRSSNVNVYRIGPRGGVKEYEGSCRVEELGKFYGSNIRQLFKGVAG